MAAGGIVPPLDVVKTAILATQGRVGGRTLNESIGGGVSGDTLTLLSVLNTFTTAGSLRRERNAASPPRNRWFVDSPLEQTGLEPPVPRKTMHSPNQLLTDKIRQSSV